MAGEGDCFGGVRGARWLAGKDKSFCGQCVPSRIEKCARQNKDTCVVKDFGGQWCVCCAARDGNVD